MVEQGAFEWTQKDMEFFCCQKTGKDIEQHKKSGGPLTQDLTWCYKEKIPSTQEAIPPNQCWSWDGKRWMKTLIIQSHP